MISDPRVASSVEKRFWAKVDKTKLCWRWTGTKSADGYGYFSVSPGSSPVLAHRVAYELTRGSIPEGLVVSHLCGNPSCVRPEHLKAQTWRETVLSGRGITADEARREKCPQGHPYTPENTILDREGKRHCRECNRVRSREYQRRKKDQLLVVGEQGH